jgi:hypothetical protein
MRTVADYLALIPSKHNKKAKFMASLSASVTPFAENTIVANSLQTLFDLDTATGIQLDIIGLWIGKPRRLVAPIDPYFFSFDIAGLGFDQGIWKGPFDPVDHIVSLSDDLYRVVLKTKVLSNKWDGTNAGAAAIVAAFSNGTGYALTLTDNQDRTMTLGHTGAAPPALYVAIIQQGFIPPKPAGVSIIYNLT